MPVPLAQQWVRDRYRQALDRAFWGGQVASSQFIIPTAYSTGTVTVTLNSTTVTGSGTAWNGSLIGQQLYIGGLGPYYTVVNVATATQIEIDQAYGKATTVGAQYEIAQCYVTPPSDFLSFKSIVDPVNNWRLRFNITQEYLDRIDANRATTGNAWLFADYRHSTAGIPRYEVWPRVTSQAQYPFLYYKRPADLTADSDVFMTPIRGDEIKRGALADLACWPGTETRKNPTFNLNLAMKYEKDFTMYLDDIQRVDQDTYLDDYIDPMNGWNGTPGQPPISAAWWQNHDV